MGTFSATPTPDADTTGVGQLTEPEVLTVAVAGAVLVALAIVLARALGVAARYPVPAMATLTLAVVTLAAMAGYVVTEAPGLETIAATAVGALAGTVTALFGRDRKSLGRLEDKKTDVDQHDGGEDNG